MITAVVLSKNEEKNIKSCLQSLSFCQEIIVIDDESSDNTRKIAEKFKAKVYIRKLSNDFASQRNFGLKKAKGDWVLFVDADEKISLPLQKEILNSLNDSDNKACGYIFKRKDIFCNKELRFGETSQVKLLRLAKKNSGWWQGAVHEVWQVKGKVKILKNYLIHQRNITLKDFLKRINFYSDIRAKELYNQKKKTNMVMVFLYPLGKFFQNYFWRLGFLDGIPGFLMAGMMSLHSFMVRSKLWVMNLNEGREEFKITNWRQYA